MLFRVDREENRIRELEARKFSNMRIREREHLQEWIAANPESLGEDLLIIQKEFAGFADTKERLDLLALDRHGNLVIIELKLDDTGRDLVWQAFKYTAYCSTLTKAQIVEIYQQYLDRYCGGGNATEQICEFLDKEELSQTVLNSRCSQRVILVAAKFRKEVTATVLWAMEYNLAIKCFEATPYSYDEEVFVDITQIIPVPEAEDFMVSVSKKESEERKENDDLQTRGEKCMQLWKLVLESFQRKGMQLFQNVSAPGDSWIKTAAGGRGCSFYMVINSSSARVEVNIDGLEQEKTKQLYDQFYARKDEIEAGFGRALEWKRNEQKKASIIRYTESFDSYERENWPEMAEWFAKYLAKLEAAFKKPQRELSQKF